MEEDAANHANNDAAHNNILGQAHPLGNNGPIPPHPLTPRIQSIEGALVNLNRTRESDRLVLVKLMDDLKKQLEWLITVSKWALWMTSLGVVCGLFGIFVGGFAVK